MILEAIHDEGRHDFSTEVLNCAGDKELQFVAHIYVHHFLRLCASKLFLANLFLTIDMLLPKCAVTASSGSETLREQFHFGNSGTTSQLRQAFKTLKRKLNI